MRGVAALLVVVGGCGPAPRLSELEATVFRPSCAYSTCHAAAGAANGLNLEGATWSRLVNVKATVAGKKLVVPGDVGASYLIEKLSGRAGTSMPPGDPLEAADLERLKTWIAAGAKND